MFNAEYPMIRWLERNGYDVSYITGVDTDRRGALIRNHRVFLSVGHDEYWSGTQRANVEAARDAGVNLAFFSGNEVFWKTRWERRPPHARLLQGDARERQDRSARGVGPGTWRDPRSFNPEGGQPENALTGTIFMVNSGDAAHPGARRRTASCACGAARGVASQAPAGQTSTLTAEHGRLRVGRGSRQRRAARRPGAPLLDHGRTASQMLQDYGHTYAPGTATHHLTLYRDTNGAGPDALVFGAGTVQWSWGLDANHDRGSACARRLRCSRPPSTCSPTWARSRRRCSPG